MFQFLNRQGEEEIDEEEELQAKLEAAMIARMKKIKDVNKLENNDKEKELKLYSMTSLSDNIKNNKEKGFYSFYYLDLITVFES